MLEDILHRHVNEMSEVEIEDEKRDLEDAYAEALKDNAGTDALTMIWKRIQELNKVSERTHKNSMRTFLS